MLQTYALVTYSAIHHFWWDVIIRGDHTWMDEHNGYMFLSVYAALVACVVAVTRREEV